MHYNYEKLVTGVCLNLHTSNTDACCISSRDVHSSLGNVEPGSAGVLSSMTDIHRRDDNERTKALLAR